MNAAAPILRGSRQHDLFALTAERLVYDDAVEMTQMSLAEHEPKHEHWAIACVVRQLEAALEGA